MRTSQQRGLVRAVLILLALSLTAVLPLGCQSGEQPLHPVEMTMKVSSSGFSEGVVIPEKYTCEGQNLSPELTWSEPPAGTKSLVLIMDDPDAPGGAFTHWLLFNLAPESGMLTEAVATDGPLSDGSRRGKNDFGQLGYDGPCPPQGSSHRYQFTVYALDQYLDLADGASKKQIVTAMEGHILDGGRLTGWYQR